MQSKRTKRPLRILGLGGLDHNGSAALIAEGAVQNLFEAERVTRLKNVGLCREDVLNATLDAMGIGAVDRIAVADKVYWKASEPWLRPALEKRFGTVQIDTWLHHECHAMSGYAGCGFDEAVCVSMDGKGDGLSAAAFLVTPTTQPQPLLRVPSSTSIGRLWWAASEFCGFSGFHSAGKVMALAAFGKPLDIWQPFLQLHPDGGFSLQPRGLHPDTFREVPRIVQWFVQVTGTAVGEQASDVAASVQALTEQVVVHMVASVVKSTGVRDVCLAGGVALNGLANQRLVRDGVVCRLYVPPWTDDRGLALGAAVRTSIEEPQTLQPSAPLAPFLGPHPATCEPPSGWRRMDGGGVSGVAELIDNGQVVAVCRGADEAGPRALGHRSLLASPRPAGMRDKLNSELKRREAFRPFGIAVTLNAVSDWMEMSDASPFMLRIARVHDHRRADIPSAVHVDGTTRVQTVVANDGSGLWDVLCALEGLGHPPVVLNTSLNGRGEPIAHSVADAAKSCERMGVAWLFTDSGLYEIER